MVVIPQLKSCCLHCNLVLERHNPCFDRPIVIKRFSVKGFAIASNTLEPILVHDLPVQTERSEDFVE